MTPTSEPPSDRFCDLVMKGGITSGVVYPQAIGLLSRHYRFHSIGGTSVGAIAAAVTAAAEYQRRRTGASSGFALLEQLPAALLQPVGDGRSKLLSLFQPQRGTRRLFRVLVGSLNKGTYGRVASIAGWLLLAYWPATLGSVLLAAAAASAGASLLAAVLAFIVTLAVSIGAWVYFDLTRGVVLNGFGLCTGMTEDRHNEALVPWLHALIQTAAGRRAGDDPLTFGDLWNADATFPPVWLGLPPSAEARAIDLQMFSTNLAHGRPYLFPLPEPDAKSQGSSAGDQLYYQPAELSRYLPADVMRWMEAKSAPYAAGESDASGRREDSEVRELPSALDFPVLLAARMSLSFPLLFSAVPLHALDAEAPIGKRSLRRCWFSDGGLCSNFPMHLFDGLVPRWPTFGIDLEPMSEGQRAVDLPSRYDEGYGERWHRFAEDGNLASRFGGFVIALVGAMQNWNDNSLARMPGFRDRVARVRLKPNEGGLNLNMEREVIDALAGKGGEAAAMLAARFAALSPAGGQAAGWDEHRLVRLNVLLKMIEARAASVANALRPNSVHATDFSTLLDNALQLKSQDGHPAAPPGYEQPLTVEQRDALDALIAALGSLFAAFSDSGPNNPFRPIPRPELRIRPPL